MGQLTKDKNWSTQLVVNHPNLPTPYLESPTLNRKFPISNFLHFFHFSKFFKSKNINFSNTLQKEFFCVYSILIFFQILFQNPTLCFKAFCHPTTHDQHIFGRIVIPPLGPFMAQWEQLGARDPSPNLSQPKGVLLANFRTFLKSTPPTKVHLQCGFFQKSLPWLI